MYLNAISYYLPEQTLTNEDIHRDFPEWSVDKIARKTGIYSRRRAAPDETSGDMAVRAAENLFEEHRIDRAHIDFVLLCTQSPDYFLPTTACLLQDRLKLPTTCGALDFNLGCSGYVYGLGIAKGLIATGQARRVLLITSETYSKFVGARDKSNKTIFGDAAAATLVSDQPLGYRIREFVYGTDGSGGKHLMVPEGGMRNRSGQQTVVSDEYGNERASGDLYMDGQEVFLFTLTQVPRMVRETVLKNRLTVAETDLFIFHQANQFILEHLRKKLKIAPERFVLHLRDTGNTVSSTIPIALCEVERAQRARRGAQVMLAGFGVGLSWGGTVLEKL